MLTVTNKNTFLKITYLASDGIPTSNLSDSVSIFTLGKENDPHYKKGQVTVLHLHLCVSFFPVSIRGELQIHKKSAIDTY